MLPDENIPFAHCSELGQLRYCPPSDTVLSLFSGRDDLRNMNEKIQNPAPESPEDPSPTVPLSVAALLGKDFEIPFFLSLGFSPEVLDQPFDTGILVPEGSSRARFQNEEDRQMLLKELTWSARRKWNGRIAELIERRSSPSAEAAQFFAEAHRYADACRHWLAVGQEACERADYTTAHTSLVAALEHFPPDGDPEERLTIIDRLIHCFQASGDAERLLSIGEDLLRNAGNVPERASQARRILSSAFAMAGDAIKAVEQDQKAAEAGDLSQDWRTRVRGWAEYGLNLLHLFRVSEGEEALLRAFSSEEAKQDPRWGVILHSDLALAYAMKGQRAKADQLADRAMEIALSSGNHELVARAYRRKANVACYAADYRKERNSHLESIALCQLQKQTEDEQSCLACLSYSLIQTGEWSRALETSRKVTRSDADPMLKAIANLAEFIIYGFRGEIRRAQQLARETLRQYREMDAVNFDFYPLWLLGFLAELQEQPEEARDFYRELRLLWKQRFDFHDAVPGLLFGAGHAADNRDPEALAETLDCLTRIAEHNGCDENEAALAATRAEQRQLEGDSAKAREHFLSSIKFSDRVGAPIFAVHLRWRFWKLLVANGDSATAETIRREAVATAKQLGIRPYLDRFRNNFSLSDAPPSQDNKDRSPANSLLTRRQIEVLRAIGEGMTNKEAAEFLGLSSRTIEMHVAGAMERLNSRSRVEAVRKASDEGYLD